MMFSPHTLQKKVPSTETEDEYGHPVIGNDTWIDVCMCRCDDNTTKEFKKENGDVYRPSYHIVSDPNTLKAGDEIRCLNKDGSIRGQGVVYIVKNTNLLSYTELWV